MFHSAGGRDVRWNAQPETLRFLAEHIEEGARTLEIGAGASTLVCAAAGARHTAISPFAQEHERIVRYAEKIDIDPSDVTFVPNSSDRVLPTLTSKEPLDLIFIDGTHAFPYAMVEWHYLRRLLRPGGHLLMDDVPIPTVGFLFRFLQADPDWQLVSLLDSRAAAFQKLCETPVEQTWREQALNAAYPDYAYLPLDARIRAAARYRFRRTRSWLGTHLPMARTAYRRVASR
jgi:hypothetical protein